MLKFKKNTHTPTLTYTVQFISGCMGCANFLQRIRCAASQQISETRSSNPTAYIPAGAPIGVIILITLLRALTLNLISAPIYHPQPVGGFLEGLESLALLTVCN